MEPKITLDNKTDGRHCFSFAELTIEVGWEDSILENELQILFSILPAREHEKTITAAHISLDVEIASKPFETSKSGFKSTQVYGLSIYHGTGQTVISDKMSGFVVDYQTGNGCITLHPSFSEKPSLAKNNFFLIGLVHLFARFGYYDLHAAGLTHNGTGYLFMGPSGSGKSSLALSLVKQGWRYASDDALLLHANKYGLSVLSYRKEFYIDPGLAACLSELEPLLEDRDKASGGKFFIDLDQIWPDRFQPQFVPAKVLFCSVANKTSSSLRKIVKKEALLRILPQSASLFFNQSFAQKQIEALKQLVQQTDCYVFDAGLDVFGNPGKAATVLETIR